MGERGPDLLAVEDVVLTVLHRAGLERGQIGARVGLRVALTPDLLAGEHLGRVALLLLLRPVGNDGRARHAYGEDVEDGRRLVERHLLLQDHLFHEGEATAPVFLGPGEPHEAVFVHQTLPAPEELVGLGTRHVGALPEPRDPVLREVLVEPVAHLITKGLLLRGQREVHTPSSGTRRKASPRLRSLPRMHCEPQDTAGAGTPPSEASDSKSLRRQSRRSNGDYVARAFL